MSKHVPLLFVALWAMPGSLHADPFSVSVPGQAIPDSAVTVIPVTLPPGFQQVEILELEIGGLSHANPDDLDIYLVSPFGAVAEIMTDRGGITAVSALTLTFADTAGGVPPDAGPLVTGLYRPEGLHEAADGGLASLSTPSPATDPWNLLIIDDSAGSTGSVDSVTLRGEGTAAPVPAVSEWGLAILTLVGLVAGTILFRPMQTS